MTALKVVHPTQPHGLQAALLTERASFQLIASSSPTTSAVGGLPPACRQLSAGDMPIICAAKHWRYLDLPFPPDGMAVRPPDPVNALTQIKALKPALASNAPDDTEYYDLVWLIHRVGNARRGRRHGSGLAPTLRVRVVVRNTSGFPSNHHR
jgi:hypothetical protein